MIIYNYSRISRNWISIAMLAKGHIRVHIRCLMIQDLIAAWSTVFLFQIGLVASCPCASRGQSALWHQPQEFAPLRQTAVVGPNLSLSFPSSDSSQSPENHGEQSSSWEHSSLNNQNFWNNSRSTSRNFPWNQPSILIQLLGIPHLYGNHWKHPHLPSLGFRLPWSSPEAPLESGPGRSAVFGRSAFFRRVVRRNQKQQQCWKIKYPT